MIYEDLGPIAGMNRNPDHSTSKLAAHKVRRVTLRETVENFAKEHRMAGFIDDDLKERWPTTPESSLRKRRTELAQENILVGTSFTRKNRLGQFETVWVHRDFHPGPPPIVERDTAPKQSKLARLEARVTDLEDMVTLALPYVEEAVDEGTGPDSSYSEWGLHRMKVLAKRMRAAIETPNERTK